ncbi:spore coat U domain-containing protein [Brucella haematophila]|nr:spore coat U domain-containing protein [Brucella haematophila]
MVYIKYAFPALVASFVLSSTCVMAQTPTATFNVQITITAACQINSATNMDFGSNGVLSTNVDATSTITVQCTNLTPYNIGLSAGSGTGATVANRLMTGPASATVGYSLYTTTARTAVWGNTVGTNTVAGTGNGAAQAYTVYGRVPVQTTPAAGVYTDTVTATISY